MTYTASGMPEGIARTLTAALIGGLVLFTVVGWVFTTGDLQRPELRWIVALGWLVIGPVALFLPPARARAIRDDADAARQTIREGLIPPTVVAAYLIGLAMAEGYGLLGAVYLFLSGDPVGFVAPAVAIVLMLLNAPTLGKARAALDTVH